MRGRQQVGRLLHYAGWALRCHVLGQRIPLTGSLILTDRCNLHCRHCTVAHLGYPPRTFAEACGDVRRLLHAGARMLVVTGGEPFVWRDGPHDLETVVRYARALGFFRTVVCTNGTFPLASSADFLWVSLDGLGHGHAALRGASPDGVLENLRRSDHPGIFVNSTLTAVNLQGFEASAERILALPGVRGIFFHLFTPYRGSDPALRLDPAGRTEVLDRLRAFKHRHPTRVTNTLEGIAALRANRWPRPLWSGLVVNGGEESPCCCRRGIADAATCRDCGCTPAVETWVIERLRLGAIRDFLRFL